MTLAERIQRLSPRQQSRLLERLNGGGETLAGPAPRNGEHAPSSPRAATGEPDQIIAYVVLRPGHAPSAADLRHFLQPGLPDFMVPNHFVFLESLPLTPNGKVDRHALPAPVLEPARPAAGAACPRSETETTLAKIWAEALHAGSVGIHDNFFYLGGHSLLALQVMARVRDAFKADLPLRTLFDFPTVAGLAEIIDRVPRNSAAAPIRKIARRTAGEPAHPVEREIVEGLHRPVLNES
jgi:acyl carrier protein